MQVARKPPDRGFRDRPIPHERPGDWFMRGA
jgi:hypothetical protein